MNIFIAGGSGFLGKQMVPLAREWGSVTYSYYSNDPFEPARGVQLDLRDGAATLAAVTAAKPDVIIHLGGSNRSPDGYNVIVAGTENITAAAEATGARLIQMSTDVLFDGTAAPYQESAEPTPIHDYGRAKAVSEKIVARYPNHVIVRTSLIYSSRQPDPTADWMGGAIAKGETVTLFNNQLRNPIEADDLSLACMELAQNEFTGVLHVAGEQSVVRCYFGRKILTRWNIPTDNVIDAPDTTGKYPLDVRLDVSLAQSILTTKLRGVDEVFG